MTDQKKLKVIEEAFNYYHDRNSLTSKDEKELLNLVNELYAAISVTRCCESDSEQLLCKHCDNKKVLHSEATGLCPDRFKHFEAK